MMSLHPLVSRVRAGAAVLLACALMFTTGTTPVSAARPAAAAEAPLTIASDPAGAQVYLDGSFVGQTPLNLAAAPGSHRIRVTKTGYLENSRIVTVGGTRTRLSAFNWRRIARKTRRRKRPD